MSLRDLMKRFRIPLKLMESPRLMLWAVYIHYLGDKEKIFVASNVYGKFKRE